MANLGYYADSSANILYNWTSGTNWVYAGSGIYEDSNYDGYIKVDKGSPDKARYVIFYAIKKKKDPMIFCKSKTEVNKEIKKLVKREDVDAKSIRVFSFAGGMKKKN